jgi:hypothetical protein
MVAGASFVADSIEEGGVGGINAAGCFSDRVFCAE